jgi:hypothetical protein
MRDERSAPAVEKVVIALAGTLTPGEAANAAACIAAGLAASDPTWAGKSLLDAAGLLSAAASHRPIAVLRADEGAMSALMQSLAGMVMPEGGVVSLFPAYAQAIHEAHVYWDRHRTTEHMQVPLLGIGFAGPKRWVSRLTGNLPLWR